jgi:DNA polymerase eta
MKKHGIAEHEPMGVLQWKSLIALNYAAKERGIKRGMTSIEALRLCTELKLVHVATIKEVNGEEVHLDSELV